MRHHYKSPLAQQVEKIAVREAQFASWLRQQIAEAKKKEATGEVRTLERVLDRLGSDLSEPDNSAMFDNQAAIVLLADDKDDHGIGLREGSILWTDGLALREHLEGDVNSFYCGLPPLKGIYYWTGSIRWYRCSYEYDEWEVEIEGEFIPLPGFLTPSPTQAKEEDSE